jgi:hypothetical protein
MKSKVLRRPHVCICFLMDKFVKNCLFTQNLKRDKHTAFSFELIIYFKGTVVS